MKKLISLVLLLAAAAFGQSVHSNVLTWTWTQTGGDPITGFHVQRAAPCTTTGCTGAGTFATITDVGPAVLTYTDATPASGQTWFYQVQPFNPGGVVTSNVVTLVTPFLPPSGTVTLSGASH